MSVYPYLQFQWTPHSYTNNRTKQKINQVRFFQSKVTHKYNPLQPLSHISSRYYKPGPTFHPYPISTLFILLYCHSHITLVTKITLDPILTLNILSTTLPIYNNHTHITYYHQPLPSKC